MIRRFLFTASLLFFSLLPSSCDEIKDLLLTNEEIVAGLKEALNQGASEASGRLGVTDGYLKDAAVKILLPPDARSVVESAIANPLISTLGLKTDLINYTNDVILKMNRGAEKAAGKAVPIFANAITSMSISDALNILKGTDTAATGYLRASTYQPLTSAFSPEINSALEEVGANSSWETLTSFYNNYIAIVTGEDPINTNLGEYATQKALDGLFLKVADEEKAIRNDPMKRGSELLKKVFKEQD